MKKTLVLLIICVHSILHAEEAVGKRVYIKGTDITVDSATLKNGLAMQNSLVLNRYIGGTTYLAIPATNRFKGKGIEIGLNSRHSGLLQTDFGISFATLFADSNYLAEYTSSTLRLTSGTTTTAVNLESLVSSEYTSNRLQTANIKLVENIFLFHDSSNNFLQGLALRLGGEIYGNEVKVTSPYYLTSAVSSGAFSLTGSGFSANTIDKIKYNEAYLNAVLGFGYTYKIAEGHNISFGYEYLKSVENGGNYENKTRSLFVLTPTLSLPSENKIKGKVNSELIGNRISIGYVFSVSENVSLGLSYSQTEATHRVVDSKVKEPGNILTILTGSSSGFNPLPFLLGSQPGFGPFPESKDFRKQIGFEVIYKF
ncbi:hypothetical protein [Leptospira jelokensis]|uniref:hypothetical protein n=1 Tax=Leptospira jelokensis TaxID=2484931 RepID=UPI0010914C65|nr:hypothetical protein [Leptospira jelokensis]TGM00174.1 hypothetical protein EHQ79_14110 [Leptospira jelokensis]